MGGVVSRCRALALARAGRYVSQEGQFWLLVTCMLCNRVSASWRVVVYIVSHEVYLLVYGVVMDSSDVAGRDLSRPRQGRVAAASERAHAQWTMAMALGSSTRALSPCRPYCTMPVARGGSGAGGSRSMWQDVHIHFLHFTLPI